MPVQEKHDQIIKRTIPGDGHDGIGSILQNSESEAEGMPHTFLRKRNIMILPAKEMSIAGKRYGIIIDLIAVHINAEGTAAATKHDCRKVYRISIYGAGCSDSVICGQIFHVGQRQIIKGQIIVAGVMQIQCPVIRKRHNVGCRTEMQRKG